MIARLFHFFCEKFRKEGKRPPLFAEKLDDAGLWASDDGLVSFDEDGALQQLLVLHEDLDDGLGIIDVVIGIEPEFFKFGVFSDEVFNRIFEGGDNFCQGRLIGRGFDVENDLVFDSQFPGDRQGIGGGSSVIEVVDGDHVRRFLRGDRRIERVK